MPDLRRRVLQERDATHAVGTQIEAGLPNIKGEIRSSKPVDQFSDIDKYGIIYNGAFYPIWGTQDAMNNGYRSAAYMSGIGFDASKSSSIYSDDITTVQPPAYAVRYLIRARP